MSTLSFFLRDTAGKTLAYIPAEAWLYLDMEIELGELGRFEGILSTRRFKELPAIFDLSKTDAPLDAVLEVWYRPFTARNQTYIKPYLLTQYLFRYERREYLPGGRPRETVLMRGPNHLLTRPLVYPPGDLPLIVTDDASLAIAIASYTTGIPAPPVVTNDYYEGAVAPADTSTQMTTLMSYCKINTPEPLSPINITPQPAGGIVDHRTAYRYDSTVLAGLQRLSAASWYAWTKGLCPTPVDFSLEPSTTPPYFPWEFKVWPGGRGTDRRISNPFGNVPLVFSAERDNVQQASALVDRLEEITATVVGGQGNGALRDVLRIEDAERIDDSPWNYSQRFLHASKNTKFTDPGGVEMAYQAGQAFVQEKSPRVQVSLTTRTRQGAIFGRDVFLGDLCTQSVLGTTRDMQVGKVLMKATSDSPLEIKIELRTLDGAQFDGSNEYQKVLRRIAGVREDAEYLGEAY